MRASALLRFAGPLLAAALAAPVAAQEPTVVILVRHAEKAAQPANDPPLSPEGEARVRALTDALDGAQLDAIVTTQYQRTRLTAAPLAEARHIAPTIVPAGAGGSAVMHARAVADTIRARFAGRTVLVVGHSNTTPKIITALGGPPMDDLCDNQYDGLYTLVIRPGGGVSLVQGHYGAVDGPAPPDCARAMRQGR